MLVITNIDKRKKTSRTSMMSLHANGPRGAEDLKLFKRGSDSEAEQITKMSENTAKRSVNPAVIVPGRGREVLRFPYIQ
jgi:hypothetical protein